MDHVYRQVLQGGDERSRSLVCLGHSEGGRPGGALPERGALRGRARCVAGTCVLSVGVVALLGGALVHFDLLRTGRAQSRGMGLSQALEVGDDAAVTTTAITTEVMWINQPPWHLVEGYNRACRGKDVLDDSPTNFGLVSGVITFDECRKYCERASTCTGIEHSSKGRCELWTQRIRASQPAIGYTCLQYERLPEVKIKNFNHLMEQFEPVGGGRNQACRGGHGMKDEEAYSVHFGTVSLDDCKLYCLLEPKCAGIEYNLDGRCEVWKQFIHSSSPFNGFTCLRNEAYTTTTSTTTETLPTSTRTTTTSTRTRTYTATTSTSTTSGTTERKPLPDWARARPWNLIDGGVDRACHDGNGNVGGYVTMPSGQVSLEDCKALCTNLAHSTGMEYSADGECKVFTGKVSGSSPSPGSTCLQYVPGSPAAVAESVRLFEAVDGGENRACHETSRSDGSGNTYALHHGVSSLVHCKAHCVGTAACAGIGYSEDGRCRILSRVEGSEPVQGHRCFRYTSRPPASYAG